MKRLIATSILALFIPAAVSAQYVVILKDGKRYRAAERWKIVDGKALLRLESGTLMQLDPTLIDVPATDRANQSNLGDARVIDRPQSPGATETRPAEPSLGSVTKLRGAQPSDRSRQADSVAPSSSSGNVPQQVMDRYRNAYENLGLYDANIRATGPAALRIELLTENEQQVFNALSATAYLMERLPGTTNVEVSEVELNLITRRGGYAGRFRMNREDAAKLESKTITPQVWFVEKVIF